MLDTYNTHTAPMTQNLGGTQAAGIRGGVVHHPKTTGRLLNRLTGEEMPRSQPLCAPHFMLYFSMKVPRTVPEFRRWLQAEIATLGRWIDDPEVQENLFYEAVGMIRNAQRLAIALEQPGVAAICERITTPALALPVAQRVLTECLNALQNDSLTCQ